MSFITKNFNFSWKITLVSLVLASLMITASFWQWDRYIYKEKLVETYKDHSAAEPKVFPAQGDTLEDFKDVIHQKVSLSGTYDFEREMIVINRSHGGESGYWLLTPLKISNLNKRVIISRGFIPFEARDKDSWSEFRFKDSEEILGVVQETVPQKTVLSPNNPEAGGDKPFVERWRYPDIEKIAKQLPYPVITNVFIQKIGGPEKGKYPAESISIRVPPSTHFGYTIEWALLALATLTIGFLMQAFRRPKKET